MSSASQRQRAASAVGGKTARACDGCAQRRARWYCAADDAFLCQGCDAFVHSANPLARRHERLRLKTSSSSFCSLTTDDDDAAAPAWHHGFKRKARTPRPHQGKARAPGLVPELDASGEENGEEEEQLLYRVPIFDPVLAEFFSPPPVDEPSNDTKPAVHLPDYAHASTTRGMSGILQTDTELAADVESLLAEGLHDDDSSCIEGLMDQREDGRRNHCMEESGTMKVEPDHEMAVGNGAICHVDAEVEMSRDILDINFDCASPTPGEDADEAKAGMAGSVYGEAARVMLRLDYEAIIEAWSSNGSSPWTSGERPQFGLDDYWPEYMGVWGGGDVAWGVCGVVGAGQVDGDREARVTRYREKRRTRLFAKKIRYEVRKLNAEKRPRMKGRFVKRASFPAPVAVSY